MDLRQLEMFVAVADSLSFTRASAQLHVVRSAVSRKVTLLEEELGVKLFTRVNKKIYLTPEGDTLIRHARKVFQELRNTSLEVSSLSHLRKGRLRIGAIIWATVYLLPPILRDFKQLYPGVDIDLVTGNTESLLAKIHANSVELGVLTLPVQFHDLEVIPCYTEEMVVVTGSDHCFPPDKKSIDAGELESCPFILPQEGYTRRIVDNFFHEAQINPKIVLEVDNVISIKPLVKLNLGVTIMPLPAVLEEVGRGELHCFRIRDYNLARHLGLVYPKLDHIPKIITEFARLFAKSGTGS